MLQVTDCPRVSAAGVRSLCLLWVLGVLGGRRCGALPRSRLAGEGWLAADPQEGRKVTVRF